MGLDSYTVKNLEVFSSLATKYGLLCKNLVENQKQRIDYWEKKGNKTIK